MCTEIDLFAKKMLYKVVLDRNERKKMEEGKSNSRNRSCVL